MITQVSETDFIDAFRAIRPDNFTYNGLKALYAYLEDLEDNIGEQIHFDVIGICCDFVEYKNWAEFENDFSSYVNDHSIKDLEDLRDHTTVIPISKEYTAMDINGIMASNKDGFIIQAF